MFVCVCVCLSAPCVLVVMLEKGQSGTLWRRLVAIPTSKTFAIFVCEVSVEKIKEEKINQMYNKS